MAYLVYHSGISVPLPKKVPSVVLQYRNNNLSVVNPNPVGSGPFCGSDTTISDPDPESNFHLKTELLNQHLFIFTLC
jgi:hypothetical protein